MYHITPLFLTGPGKFSHVKHFIILRKSTFGARVQDLKIIMQLFYMIFHKMASDKRNLHWKKLAPSEAKNIFNCGNGCIFF
jgi:hypothetical protein